MNDWPTAAIVGIPATGAVIYVVRLFLAAQKDWKRDVKSMMDSSNGVIERNTTALMEIKSILGGCERRQGKDGA